MSSMRAAVAGLAMFVVADAAGAQSAPSGGAQGGPPSARSQGGRGQAMLFEGITLTASQQEQVDSVRARYRAQREAMMPNGGGAGRPDPAAREKMGEMMDKQNAELRAILTADQQKVFDRNVEEMKKRREQMRAQPRS